MAKKLAALGAVLVLGVLMLLYSLLGVKTFDAKTITDNPATGFAPMAASGIAEAEQLVYVNLRWSEWEPEKGQYAYNEVSEKYRFDEYRAAGKHLVLRFVCDIPSSERHMDIPQWLYDETQDGEFYQTDYGMGYCPDYNNADFIAAHADAIAALGAWLSEDNFCLYVELGSLGHWGEWHTKAEDGLPRMPNADVCAKYVQPYVDGFKTAKLLMRRPFSFVSEYGMGVFNDMVGAPEDTNEWLDWLNNGGDYTLSPIPQTLTAVPKVWLTAPVGGEFTSSIDMSDMLGSDLSETLSLIKQSHMSFIGPKIPEADDGVSEAAIEAVKSEIGYQYRISKLKKRGNAFTLTWVNDGAAPLYWDWEVKLCALDADGNIIAETPVDIKLSQLAPGQKIKTAAKLDISGEAEAYAVAIIDPLTNAPAVRLSMDCAVINGMSVIAD